MDPCRQNSLIRCPGLVGQSSCTRCWAVSSRTRLNKPKQQNFTPLISSVFSVTSFWPEKWISNDTHDLVYWFIIRYIIRSPIIRFGLIRIIAWIVRLCEKNSLDFFSLVCRRSKPVLSIKFAFRLNTNYASWYFIFHHWLVNTMEDVSIIWIQ